MYNLEDGYNLFLERLAIKIREKRKLKQLTQTEMENGEFGIEYKFYQKIENGKSINLKTLYKICKRLNIHPKELFEDFDFE